MKTYFVNILDRAFIQNTSCVRLAFDPSNTDMLVGCLVAVWIDPKSGEVNSFYSHDVEQFDAEVTSVEDQGIVVVVSDFREMPRDLVAAVLGATARNTLTA